MKVSLIYVGKTKENYLQEGEKEYFKRINRYISFDLVEIPDIKNGKNKSEEEIKILEGDIILKKLKNTDYAVLLDENGRQFTSVQFADYMQRQFNAGSQGLIFIIGGAYGFSEALYQRADAKLSLSKMTFSHQMVRMFFMEQLYRGMTILNNEPYHHQ